MSILGLSSSIVHPPPPTAFGYTNPAYLVFDGTDKAYLPNTATDAKTQPVRTITVSVWFYLSDYSDYATGATNENWIISCWDQPDGYFMKAVNGKVIWGVRLNGSTVEAESGTLGSGWHHIVGTCDGQYVKCYINSALADTTDAGAAYDIDYGTNDLPTMIGSTGPTLSSGVPVWDDTKCFEGYIDQLAIWNVALSEAQISDIHNRGYTLDLQTPQGTNYALEQVKALMFWLDPNFAFDADGEYVCKGHANQIIKAETAIAVGTTDRPDKVEGTYSNIAFIPHTEAWYDYNGFLSGSNNYTDMADGAKVDTWNAEYDVNNALSLTQTNTNKQPVVNKTNRALDFEPTATQGDRFDSPSGARPPSNDDPAVIGIKFKLDNFDNAILFGNFSNNYCQIVDGETIEFKWTSGSMGGVVQQILGGDYSLTTGQWYTLLIIRGINDSAGSGYDTLDFYISGEGVGGVTLDNHHWGQGIDSGTGTQAKVNEGGTWSIRQWGAKDGGGNDAIDGMIKAIYMMKARNDVQDLAQKGVTAKWRKQLFNFFEDV